MSSVAAIVFNYRCDILAWNSLYHQIFAPHLDLDAPNSAQSRPNIIKLNFLDERVWSIYPELDAVYRSNVAFLRFVAADHPQDASLAGLVKELMTQSDEFSKLWRDSYDVETCANGQIAIEHPTVGPLDLMYEAADMRDGTLIKFYHPDPGASSEAAFAQLRDGSHYSSN